MQYIFHDKLESLRPPVLFLILSSIVVSLSGCAAALVTGTAVGISTLHDRRTTGAIVEDESIEFKAESQISSDPELEKNSHVSVVSFNSKVLITGQTNDESIKKKIGSTVANIEKVKEVHNQLRIAAPSSTLTRGSDAWITSKIKVLMLAEKDLDPSRIKVVTENGEVFLMGLVDKGEAAKAIAVTRTVSGVQRVIELFEYIRI